MRTLVHPVYRLLISRLRKVMLNRAMNENIKHVLVNMACNILLPTFKSEFLERAKAVTWSQDTLSIYLHV